MKAIISYVHTLLITTTLMITAPAVAQKAEPAVQPEDPAEKRLPLEQAVKRTRPPALTIELPPPEAPEEPDEAPEQVTPHPAKIGIHRLIPEQWRGNLAAYLTSGSVEVTSRGAQSVRVALSVTLPDGGRIVFSGADGKPIYTLEAHELPVGNELVWSPVVDDETIRVELEDAGPRATVSIEKVAHIDPDVELQPRLQCSNHIDVRRRTNDFPEGLHDAIVKGVRVRI